MPSENGSTLRGASAFEAFFLAARGRSPTAEEAKRCLAFDRLAKTSELDPATLAFIVGDSAPLTEKTLEAIVERLERVEQGVDDLKKQPAAASATPSDLTPQMARLEALLRKTSARADPFAGITRYFLAFAAGVAVCELIFAAIGHSWLVSPMFDRIGMFTLGLSATAGILIYLWLWPLYREWRKAQHW